MFDNIKKFFTSIGYAWQYSDVIRRVSAAWTQFPGWHDSELLRLWIRPLLIDLSVLTVLTKTPIADVIAAAAVRIVNNNTSWRAVFALAELVRDGLGVEGTQIPQRGGHYVSAESIAREACPECPAAGLAALGILLYFLQQRKVR